MQQSGSKRSRVISSQLKQKIKKKPYGQQIGSTYYTYSLLKKKNQVFIMSNQRLLVLIGNQSIGYARQIPESTVLPFDHQSNLPPFKYNINLSAVVKVSTDGDHLKIQFVPQSKLSPWEFLCSNREVALEWKQAIQEAVRVYHLSASNRPLEVNIPHETGTQGVNNLNQQNALGPLQQVPQVPPQVPTPTFAQPPKPHQTYSEQNNQLNIPAIWSQQTQQPGMNQALQTQAQRPLLINNSFGNLNSNIQNQSNYQNTQNVPQNYQPNPQINIMQPQMQQTQPLLPLGLVTQYQKMKINQSRLKEHLQDHYQEELNSNTFKTPQKHRLEQSRTQNRSYSDCHWDYEFAKSEDQYLIIDRFRQKVQNIVVPLVEEQALQRQLQTFKPTDVVNGLNKYFIEGITFEMSLLQLSQTSSFHDQNTIVSPLQSKTAQTQFKNANYILQCTRNQGRFRVPLMMITHFKGFQIVAKAGVHSAPEYTAPVNALQNDIVQLEQDTRVSRELFEEQEHLKVVAGDSRWFQKLARTQNKHNRFDICFLTDIRHYIPQDFFRPSRDSPSFQLRPQLIQEEGYEGLLFAGGNLSGFIIRANVPTDLKKAINLLAEVSNSIPSKIQVLVQDLQSLDVTITNSEQLASLMHQNGINMRYLGMLYDSSKQPWLRSIILAQIVARSAKYLLKYQLQQAAQNMGMDSVQRAHQFQIGQVLGWLNKVMGIGQESQSLWRQLMRQAQNYFKIPINREGINIGFLIQALQHHGGFKLRLGPRKKLSYFKASNNFTRNQFLEFTLKSKVYDPIFTDHYTAISRRLQTLSFQNYQFLSSLLNIDKRSSLQPHYFLNKRTGNQLISYMSNWLSPQQAPFLYPSLQDKPPSKHLYQGQLTAIKWELKANRLRQAERLRDQLIDHVNQWLGQAHPVLTQLYQLFGHYYLSFDQEIQNAQNYAKSVLNNQEQLLGPNHFKLADAYYALADVQLHYARKGEALTSCKKALQIIQDNREEQSEAYLQTNLKMAQIYLIVHGVQEGVQCGLKALALAQRINDKEKYLVAAELLGRLYEVSSRWDEYSKLIHQIVSTLSLFSDSLSLFQRLLKVLLMPSLSALSTRYSTAQSVLSLLRGLPDYSITQKEAFEFIKAKIDERSFPWLLIEGIDSAQILTKQIEQGGLARKWRGFESDTRQPRGLQFLSQLEATRHILGKQFIQGALQNE